MKVYNPKTEKLSHELKIKLDKFRKQRDFSSQKYISQKAYLLNEYMREHNLKACVVAVSGGIDSAVVLGLVNYAKNTTNSPIKKIVPLLLPVQAEGATGQDKALERGEKVVEQLGLEKVVIDLTQNFKSIKKQIDSSNQIRGEGWAGGQLVSYLRTPVIYYTTSLLSQENIPSIVCGTTNRDEGDYLGYFGKASDGLVDIQLIADIHKSEVYKLAKELNLPKEIIDVIPTGDMYDARVDEEVFGAPYDFVELYLNYLELNTKEKEYFKTSLNKKSLNQFQELSKRLDKMHNYNKHKYLGKSPAVHLNILESKVPINWGKDNIYKINNDKENN